MEKSTSVAAVITLINSIPEGKCFQICFRKQPPLILNHFQKFEVFQKTLKFSIIYITDV